ncbi:MAG: hypothetical protein ABH817_02085 [archaeon]
MKISNKLLTSLLTIAIVVSVVGIGLNVVRFNDLSITGRGVTGEVNVSIATTKGLNVTVTSCNFGSGYISNSTAIATLESNGTAVNWTGAGTSTTIIVRNDGNTDCAVNLTSAKNCSSFFGADCNANSQYQVWTDDKDSGACSSGLITHGSAVDVWDTNGSTVCEVLQFEDTTDEIYVYCRLRIFEDIPAGVKGDIWTFLAW